MSYAEVRQQLEKDLPPVTLLLGPDRPGMWTLAQQVVRTWGTGEADIFNVHLLTASEARTVVHWSGFWPFGSSFKAFIIGTDESTAQAQNILLKSLEEPPSFARYILVASALPLPTVVSRAQVMRLGGRLAGHEDDKQVRALVQAAVKAAADATYSSSANPAALRSWKEEHTDCLRRWAGEAASGRWRSFDAAFATGVTPQQARRLLALLALYRGARTAALVALGRAFRQ